MMFKQNTGFSLIEVLVAFFVFATGILVIASTQLQSMKMLSNSDSIYMATVAANDMAERMRVNAAAVFDGFYDSLDQTVSAPTCTTACSEAETASADVYEVYQQLTGSLANPTLSVSNLGNNIFTVEVTWNEQSDAGSTTKSHRVSFYPYKP